jgi:flagellar biosynthetic protein FliR
MNLFAVGLPAALLTGLVLLAIAAPVMADAVLGAIRSGLEMAGRLAVGR